jgi:hypothetical protein
MKIERGVDTEGVGVTAFYDDDGKLVYAQRDSDCGPDSMDYIISNKTIKELKAILKQAGCSLPPDLEWKFYCNFNNRLMELEWRFNPELGGAVEKQAALLNLIRAFEALGPDGQETLTNAYRYTAGLHPANRRAQFSTASEFLIAAKSLLTQPEGRGRKRDYGTETKIMLAGCAWDLFEALGLKTPITNTGHLAQFISVLWKDPALGELRGSPEDLRDYLREIKKTKKTPPRK